MRDSCKEVYALLRVFGVHAEFLATAAAGATATTGLDVLVIVLFVLCSSSAVVGATLSALVIVALPIAWNATNSLYDLA